MSDYEARQRTETRNYLLIVRRHVVLAVTVVAVVLVSAVVLTYLQEPSYTSKGRLLVARGDSAFSATERVTNPDFVQTEIQFLESEGVRELVRASLGSAPKVEASQVGTTSVVEVRADGPDPESARATVDAYMSGYLTYRRQVATEDMASIAQEVRAAVDDLQRQIDALSAQLRTVNCPATGECAERTAIEQDRDARVQEQVPFRQKLSELSIDASSANVGTIVIPASLPTEPSSPNPVRNGIVALALGTLLGAGLAILFELVDDSIRDTGDVERCAPDVPVLAVIPHGGRAKAKSTELVTVEEEASPSAEAYRTLRTSIRFLAVDRPLRSLQITSATSEEGKTTTAANLGVVLARAGELVILVNCDLRRPKLHELFGVSNEVGLTSVLLGEAALTDALKPVTSDRRLWLLPAGPRPPNPSDLLSSDRTSQVLTKLQSQASIVVVDSPPVLALSDAAILSAKVDGMLLVTRAGVSSRKRVTRAVDVLQQLGAPLLGTVLNTSSPRRGDDGAYWVVDDRLDSPPGDEEPGLVWGANGSGAGIHEHERERRDVATAPEARSRRRKPGQGVVRPTEQPRP